MRLLPSPSSGTAMVMSTPSVAGEVDAVPVEGDWCEVDSASTQTDFPSPTTSLRISLMHSVLTSLRSRKCTDQPGMSLERLFELRPASSLIVLGYSTGFLRFGAGPDVGIAAGTNWYAICACRGLTRSSALSCPLRVLLPFVINSYPASGEPAFLSMHQPSGISSSKSHRPR